jgi:hypothetical protein
MKWCSVVVILNKLRRCAAFEPRAEILSAAKDLNAEKDLGEPRVAARRLRRNNRAFGSLPYQTAPLPG